MKLLIVTNLYPPQELGGYGRSMADFAWGLKQRGHEVDVLTNDAPYLGPSTTLGPSNEPVNRQLKLRGSYEGGINHLNNKTEIEAIDLENSKAITHIWKEKGPFDGAIVGNIDLLGTRVLDTLLRNGARVVHHIGFVNPPFHCTQKPKNHNYQLVGASRAVSKNLEEAGLNNMNYDGTIMKIPIVYPGVRNDLFGENATSRKLPPPLDGTINSSPLGDIRNPLRVCFAGLLMGSKGAHTLIDALVMLKQQGIETVGHLAGGSFQAGYEEHLKSVLAQNGLDGIHFTGQLNRESLARFFRLHHICVFPSINPEAFGIVGAEAMASGLALVSSGVGGAAEIFQDKESGLQFKSGDAYDLADKIKYLCNNTAKMCMVAKAGQIRARKHLDVLESARQLESLLQRKNSAEETTTVF